MRRLLAKTLNDVHHTLRLVSKTFVLEASEKEKEILSSLVKMTQSDYTGLFTSFNAAKLEIHYGYLK